MLSCLLIVDVQQGFINKHTKHIPKLVEHKQHEYKNVYITQFFNPKNSFYRKLLSWDEIPKDSQDFELAFKPCNKAIIMERPQYSLGPKFLRELKSKGINALDICGIDTDICVLKNTVDLIENGITSRVLANYCASTAGPEFHEFAIKILVRFVSEKQVIFGLT